MRPDDWYPTWTWRPAAERRIGSHCSACAPAACVVSPSAATSPHQTHAASYGTVADPLERRGHSPVPTQMSRRLLAISRLARLTSSGVWAVHTSTVPLFLICWRSLGTSKWDTACSLATTSTPRESLSVCVAACRKHISSSTTLVERCAGPLSPAASASRRTIALYPLGESVVAFTLWSSTGARIGTERGRSAGSARGAVLARPRQLLNKAQGHLKRAGSEQRAHPACTRHPRGNKARSHSPRIHASSRTPAERAAR